MPRASIYINLSVCGCVCVGVCVGVSVCSCCIAGQVGGPIGLKLGGWGRSPLGHVLHPVGGVGVALRHAHEQITAGMQGFGAF